MAIFKQVSLVAPLPRLRARLRYMESVNIKAGRFLADIAALDARCDDLETRLSAIKRRLGQ